MARRNGELPKIRLHKASGRARVRVSGKTYWLGQFGSAEAQQRYDNLFSSARVEKALLELDEQINPSPLESFQHTNGVGFGDAIGYSDRYPKLPSVWYYPSLLPQQIPDVSAVYIVLNSKSEVLYVGETESMRRRYAEHKRWMKRRYKFSWMEVAQHERLFVQSHFIAMLRPTRNRLPGRRNTEDRDPVVMLQPVKLIAKAANKQSCPRPQEATNGR